MLCKRRLFLDIQLLQGPNIFQQLFESLCESDQKHVAGILDVLPVTRRHAIPCRMSSVDELEWLSRFIKKKYFRYTDLVRLD